MSLRVLVVEDNPLNAQLVIDLLEIHGHTAELAVDGASFRRRLLVMPVPDVVLMDILLPDSDGATLLRDMRATEPFTDVPAIAVTALAHAADSTRLLEEGFLSVITKPIDTRLFVTTIQRLLATRGQAVR
jgi:CheY-like chemotaxis protein